MNSSITQCPTCHTRFRVTPEELAAHDGIVRCGVCNEIFNAAEHLHDEEPEPQFDSPVTHEKQEPKLPVINEVDHSDKFISLTNDVDKVDTLFQQVDADVVLAPVEKNQPVAKPRRWPWVVGSILFSFVWLAQAFYFYRVDIAAQLPGLKPVLTGYCGLLKCSIPLPEKVNQMSIESSDLVADPLQPNVVTLIALLHNHAEYTQAYPNLELSLTDTQDQVLARRAFIPSDYIHPGENEKLGLGANRELSIKLHLDSGDLRPMGYKLLLFFPPKH